MNPRCCVPLSTNHPNPEYAQEEHVQVNDVLKVRQTQMAANVEICRFRFNTSKLLSRYAVQFLRPSRLRGVVGLFEEAV